MVRPCGRLDRASRATSTGADDRVNDRHRMANGDANPRGFLPITHTLEIQPPRLSAPVRRRRSNVHPQLQSCHFSPYMCSTVL